MSNHTDSNLEHASDSRKRVIAFSLLGAVFLGTCFLFIAAFIWFKPDQVSLSDLYFPPATPTSTSTPISTPSPTLTPTPHLLIAPPGGISVLKEQFDTNRNNWAAYYGDNTVRVQDGKLSLKSDKQGYVGMALCQNCPIYDKAFYFQAELLPAEETTISHGIVFCATGSSEEYYLFQIDTFYQNYSLFKSTPGGWETLIENKSAKLINRYPVSNTLSVIFESGDMELYINDTLIDNYQDPDPVACRQFGIYVNDGIVNIIADNIFAYEMEGSPVPTPTP